MGKKSRGLGSCRKLKKRKKDNRWHSKKYTKRILRLKEKSDPLEGASQAKGIVLEKVEIEPKKPSSGLRRCVKLQLIKNGRQITAFAPGEDAISLIDEHDEVVVECTGGRMGRSRGDLPGVRWCVIKVNDQSLDALLKGKIEKARK